MSAVGVAIVHYHAEDLLRRCLESLAGSTLGDFVAVVVDNGSDTGLDWVEALDRRFRVLRTSRNVGFAAGVNLALAELPEAPFLLLLNPDVFVEPRTLEESTAVLTRDPTLGAMTCKLVLPSGELDAACRRSHPTVLSAFSRQLGLQARFPRSRFFGRYNLTYLDPARPHDIDSGTGAYLLLRREALGAAGGALDERFFLYGEDLDLCRRIRESGHRILYWPGARAVHVKGSGRPRGARATIEFHRAMWTYYRKWGVHRRNVLVLLSLLAGIGTLGAIDLLRNLVRARRGGWQVAASTRAPSPPSHRTSG